MSFVKTFTEPKWGFIVENAVHKIVHLEINVIDGEISITGRFRSARPDNLNIFIERPFSLKPSEIQGLVQFSNALDAALATKIT